MSHDDELKQSAIEYANKHKKEIAEELTDKSLYLPTEVPVSIFMAGSPGAGKTEYSKNLVANNIRVTKLIRIDADELRSRLPNYNGSNSSLFQYATSILVDKIHDLALENGQSFLLDGTLSNYDRAKLNIERSLKRKRQVIIFYLYQDPLIAWKYTQARELLEGRNIPKDSFIDQFINAKETILRIRKDFPFPDVLIFLVKKNFETHEVEKVIDYIHDGTEIDQYFTKRYNRGDLEKLL